MDPRCVGVHRDDATPTKFDEETDGSGTAVLDVDDEQLVLLSTPVITSPELEGQIVNKIKLI